MAFCEQTGIPRSTLQGWLNEGKIGFVKVGGTVFIPLDQGIEVYHSPRVAPLPDRVRDNWPTRASRAG